MVNTDDVTALNRKMIELLSEYGVDRSGIDAAVDIAIEYGEQQYQKGWNDHWAGE